MTLRLGKYYKNQFLEICKKKKNNNDNRHHHFSIVFQRMVTLYGLIQTLEPNTAAEIGKVLVKGLTFNFTDCLSQHLGECGVVDGSL